MTRDYRPTVFLPQTSFPMRGGLPTKEPEILAQWQELGLYKRLRAQSRDEALPSFTLHDGPPYANGDIHVGHATNKILKDVVVRTKQMLGFDADYVPGWDCHGLPIEWKIEEKYRAAGRDKDTVPVLQFRAECREFARNWVDVQSAEFQRLGVVGNWVNPYTTMTKAAEARIVRELHKFLVNGSLYRGAKPVMWSVVEKTALAEAEVEYEDHTSTTIFVRFPIAEAPVPALKGATIVIWTTTPWTMPGNRAVAYGAGIEYGVFRVDSVAEGSLGVVGERLVLATALAEQVGKDTGITAMTLEATLPGSALAGTVVRHPLAGFGYDFPVRALPGDFVTTETGTGLVHIAPGHGEDDYKLGRKFGVEIPYTVEADGTYAERVPLFAGKRVYTQKGKDGDAGPAVLAALREAGSLLAQGKLVHSYPHSWRSHAPLIFRTTPQWFIALDYGEDTLRAKALRAIAQTRWVPEAGENRIAAMVASRPDWCISRQRTWGVPIALFVNKATGKPLTDPDVLERIGSAFEADGADAWFARDPQEFLGNAYQAADFEQVFDVVDVWFESGCTHAFVLEDRPEMHWPADLYLEGSDQHRGWFHSSLLESCGTRGRAPYDTVLTHGFVMDEQGRKMSKSLGNVVAPEKVVTQLGADILRLWVIGSDYNEDTRIGPEILKFQADHYRRLRNTLRYLLGALNGYDPAVESVPAEDMPELERWILHRLAETDTAQREAIAAYDFHKVYTLLYNFCAVDLSAFYFDVRKDSLYCDRADSLTRRAVRTVLALVFDCLSAWLAPMLCFTAEEAWTDRRSSATPHEQAHMPESVHLRRFPEVPSGWTDAALGARWEKVRTVRRVITGALEVDRAAKRLGSSLQGSPVVYISDDYRAALDGVDMAKICLTSAIRLAASAEAPAEVFQMPDAPGIAVSIGLAEGQKCERCWQVLAEVGENEAHPDLCLRCSDAVDHFTEVTA